MSENKKSRINFYWILIGIWITGLCLALMFAPAYSHSWYPRHCCSNKDCALVTKIEPVGNPLFPKGVWLTTKFGRAYLDYSNKHMPERLKSQDGKVHACILEHMDSDSDDEFTELDERNYVVKVSMPTSDIPLKKIIRCVFWPSS